MADEQMLTQITSSIVAAYVSNNSLSAGAVGPLVERVHEALSRLEAAPPEPAVEKLEPAINPKRSVFPDHIVCLEDGKRFKSMKRHLSNAYCLTPAEYRQRWGLPADYPIVAPNYGAERSALALKLGLGRKAVVSAAPMKRKSAAKPRA